MQLLYHQETKNLPVSMLPAVMDLHDELADALQIQL
ncbi:hypothetical protein FHS38_005249 [Streptomyces netropsis]|uniref:Uncharacterized protein n=1 Tax=Streptomyces netropsis TaxID=55404 RepID=A0A7W7PGK2_STRNE|nr:hypothetical protein [Streptomyces netropsis]